MANYILFELASGYALFERVEMEEIGQELDQVQQAIQDIEKFGRMIKLKSFLPFKSAVDALQNCNDVSEGICNETLKSFLEMNLPGGLSKKVSVGVGEKNLAASIKSECGIDCVCDEMSHELIRGVRFHIKKLINQLSDGNLEKTQLGLGHSYSRAKVKFNVNRADTMITQAICMLDQLDKDINTFSMRIREWYGWHFPELVKIVSDNKTYAQLARFIKNKSRLDESHVEGLEEISGDLGKAQQILKAARSSMGTDISEVDMINIDVFATRVLSLVDFRHELQDYLHSKMNHVAPNLSALIGDAVGARLISHAGSLTNLAKYPASTVQILGAEKALFRALKTRGNTPKYGLIYHSTFIGRAGAKNKGRISRYLANKCTIASRIDCFTEMPTTKFGEAMKQQVEDRLKFYETGQPTAKNADVIQSVLDQMKLSNPNESSKKRKHGEGVEKSSKKKKEKKSK